MAQDRLEDRRRFLRVPLTCSVAVTLPSGGTVRGTVVDISIHGLLARLEDPEVEEGPIGLCIDFPDGHPSFTIEADGDIVRKSPEGFIGVYFLRTDEESLENLKRLLALNIEDPEQALYESGLW